MLFVVKRKEKNNAEEKSTIIQNVPSIGTSYNKILDADEVKKGSGHNRICNFSRSSRSYCHNSCCCFSCQDYRSLVRYFYKYQSIIGRICKNAGQSTVEFAIVAAAFLAITVGLGALWHFLDAGMLVDHAVANASHHISDVLSFTVNDIFLY